MKQYKVDFYYAEYGTMEVEADSPEQAQQWVFEELDGNGPDETDYEVNDRDYEALEVKEV